MRRHDLDWVSLTDVTLDGRFVWPIVLVALGAAGVATAVTATAREEKAYAEVASEDGS